MTDNNLYQAPEAMLLNANEDVCEEMHFFSASQRLGRIRYLAYSGGVYLLFALIVGVFAGIGSVAGGGEATSATIGLLGVAYLILIVGFTVVGVRRLHDLDKSGWMYLLMLVPLINVIFGFYLIFAQGTPSSNRFGPKPLPNTTGTWIAGLVLPAVFIIGILAAIALPAYQDYTARVKAAQSQQD